MVTPSYKSFTVEDGETDFEREQSSMDLILGLIFFFLLIQGLYSSNILGFCDTKCPQLHKPGFCVYLLLLFYNVTGTKFVLK